MTETTLRYWIREIGVSLASTKPRSGPVKDSTILKKEKDSNCPTPQNGRERIYHVDLAKMSQLLGVIERRTKIGNLPGTVSAQKYIDSQTESAPPQVEEPPAYLTDMDNQPPDAIYDPNWFEQMFDKYEATDEPAIVKPVKNVKMRMDHLPARKKEFLAAFKTKLTMDCVVLAGLLHKDMLTVQSLGAALVRDGFLNSDADDYNPAFSLI